MDCLQDLRFEPGFLAFGRLRLHRRRGDVFLARDGKTQAAQVIAEAGDSKGRRADVGSATARAQRSPYAIL